MNNKAIAAIAVVAIIIIAAGVWYLYDSGDDGGDDGNTVTDVLGRTVTILEDVDGIVCLSAGSARLACYMGAYDMIVGIDSMDAMSTGSPANYYMATYRIAYDFSGITEVGSEENYRAIIDSGAEVVFTSSTDRSTVDTLAERTGLTVVALSAAGNIDVDDEEFDTNLTIMGAVLGLEDRAQELIDGKNAILADLASYKSQSDVTAECYVGGMNYMMEGGFYKTTGNYASFDYTNAVNTMPDTDLAAGNPYDTNARELVEAGAEYIFVDVMNFSSSQEAFASDREVLSELEAVQGGNIYSTMVFKYYGTNWEAELINAYYIGSILDPETYDYDFEDKVNQILDLFFPDSDISYDDIVQYHTNCFQHLDW